MQKNELKELLENLDCVSSKIHFFMPFEKGRFCLNT